MNCLLLLTLVRRSKEQLVFDDKESKSISDAHVFIINCLNAVSTILSSFTAFTAKQTESISNEMDHLLDLFVQFETRALLQEIGFYEKLLLLKSKQQSLASAASSSATAASTMEGLESETMKNLMHKFYNSLFNIEPVGLVNAKNSGNAASNNNSSNVSGGNASSQASNNGSGSFLERTNKQCERLMNIKLKKYAKNNISKELLEAYSTLYKAIHAPENGYANAQEIAFHTPQKIQNLLDI